MDVNIHHGIGQSEQSMSEESIQLPVADERLPRGGAVVRPCEFDRAYAELIAPGETGKREAIKACSQLGTEERSFPPSPTGRPYFLCNGHLRDLFEALERIRTHGA